MKSRLTPRQRLALRAIGVVVYVLTAALGLTALYVLAGLLLGVWRNICR